MADVKISQLPAATTPVSGTEELPLVQSGVTKKIALSDLSSISFGATGLTPATATSGAVVVAGTLDVNNGGTGLATLTANNVILGNGTSTPTFVAPSTSGNVLTSNGTTWVSSVPATSGTVTSVNVSGGTTGLTTSGGPITSSGVITLAGTLDVDNGGTGLTAGTSGGVLAYTATGTLASSAALTQYGVVYGGGAGAVPVATAAGTTGQVLTATTSGAPSWAAPATSGTVTSVAMTVPSVLSISGSPITSSGTLALTYSGTALPVLNGGTGVTTSTGTTNVVLSNSPTLVTPALGAATATSLVSSGTAASSFTVTSGSAVPLTITNVGTGNSFVVEDSANPDATPFVIDAAGNVIVGTTASIASGVVATAPVFQEHGLTNNLSSIGLTNWSSTAARTPSVNFNRSLGNAIGTRAGITVAGTAIGTLSFSGDDGTNWLEAARIEGLLDATGGVNDMPGRLIFSTTADGASSPTERMRISSTGQTTISGNTIVSVTDNTNAALRITQLGTGNALLVEDSTNPDSTPFVIDASGRVFVGNTAATTTLSGITPVFQIVGTGIDSTSIGSFNYSAGVNGPFITTAKSRGAAIGTETIVQSGDNLMTLRAYGSDGVAPIQAAQIRVEVDGTPGVSDMPGRLVFSTTADGASTSTERIRIDSAGRLRQFGDTILSNVNVIGASYDSVFFSVAGEETTPADLFFSPDGLKMYVVGVAGDDVNEYNLSTAWVVSSAVYSTVFSVASQDTTPVGLFFRADGTKMYIVGQTNDTVFQYTLSTPWSVATASYDSISFSVTTEESTPSGMWFKPNGLSMYVVGSANDTVYQYTLSTAWNVSTATFLQSFSVSGQETVPNTVIFTGDGSRMFVMGTSGDDVNVYNLTTPWDISTSAFVNVFSIAAQDTGPQGLYIKPDGTKMYVVGSTNDTVYQYTVPSIDIQLTGQTSVAALDVQQDLTVYGKLQAYSISASNGVLVTSPNGLGYGTGSGGAVTQLTSRTTGVTLSKPSGAITMFSAAGSIAAATFTVTNTLVAATDTIILNQKSGTNLYVLLVTAVAAGSFNVTFYTTGGIATDAPVINFSLIKGVTA